MMKGIKFCVLIMLLIGCAKNAVKEEIKSLLDNSASASGSDLMLALCGWPTYTKMQLLSLDVELSPESSRKEGDGVADISAAYNSFNCKSRIAFSYTRTYTGGHGYSGGNEIQIGGLKRLDAVDAAISDPHEAHQAKMQISTSGVLSDKSSRLPDGSYADYYYIVLENPYPLIRFDLEAEHGFNPGGYVYQNNKLIATFTCSRRDNKLPNYYNVITLEKGKAVILITGHHETGRYNLFLEEPDNAVRSMLKLPEEYKKKMN
jgi:hypothetical protein